MMALRGRYRDQLVGTMDAALASNGPALDAARDAVAEALATDRIVYAAGSGHSHLIALETFYRAGGIAAAQALLDEDLMLHRGAERSTHLERDSGRAEAVLRQFAIGPGDVVFIASNSGRNAYPIELALGVKARGATSIAITSLDHARQTSSRHPSGMRLFELADIVLDNCGVYGDAAVPIAARDIAMGPTSTILGVFLINTVLAEAVEALAARGISPEVYQSANMQGAEAQAEAMIARWRPRIAGL